MKAEEEANDARLDASALLPQGAGDNWEVLLYLDDGTTRPYALQSVSFRFDERFGVGVVCHNTEKNLHALTQNQQVRTTGRSASAPIPARHRGLVSGRFSNHGVASEPTPAILLSHPPTRSHSPPTQCT